MVTKEHLLSNMPDRVKKITDLFNGWNNSYTREGFTEMVNTTMKGLRLVLKEKEVEYLDQWLYRVHGI